MDLRGCNESENGIMTTDNTEREEPELLPCPFDGGDEVVVSSSSSDGPCVHCFFCDAYIFGDTVSECVEKWNTRSRTSVAAPRGDGKLLSSEVTLKIARHIKGNNSDYYSTVQGLAELESIISRHFAAASLSPAASSLIAEQEGILEGRARAYTEAEAERLTRWAAATPSTATAAEQDGVDILDDERVDKELRRWQDAIRDKIINMGVPDWKIDGAGCDSGDPLDFTLAEVGQGVGYFIDKLEELRVATVGKLTERIAAVFPETTAADKYDEGFNDAAKVARVLNTVAATSGAREAAVKEIIELDLNGRYDPYDPHSRNAILGILSKHFPSAVPRGDQCTCNHQCPSRYEREVEEAECVHAEWCELNRK